METTDRALVGILMSRQSDWETLRHAAEMLDQFHVPWERWIAADHAAENVEQVVARFIERRAQSLIVGAASDGALAATVAGCSPLPTLAVPLQGETQEGLESLLSVMRQAELAPLAALAVGKAGATNAALLALAILSNSRADLREELRQFRAAQTARILADSLA